MKSFLQKAFSGNLDKAIGAAQKAIPKETMGAIPTISSMVGGGALGYYSGDESAGSFVGGAVAGGIGGFAATKLLGNGRLLAGQKAVMEKMGPKSKSFKSQVGKKSSAEIGPMNGPENRPSNVTNKYSSNSLLEKAVETRANGSKAFKGEKRTVGETVNEKEAFIKKGNKAYNVLAEATNRDSFKPSGKLQSNSSSVVGPGLGKGKLNPKYSRVQKGKKNMPQRQQINNEPLGKGTEMLETISSNRNRRALFAGGALLSGGAFGKMFGVGERESLASGFNKGRGNTI